MGLFGAMTASVSGLSAQGQTISVISDNLANTNTVGYKASRALFSQLVTSSGSSGTEYNAGGLDTSVQRSQNVQGSLNATNSVTDLAVAGGGFFRVSDSETVGSSTTYFYTRAGAFSENKAGFLVNPSGYYLQGWRTDSSGNIANLQDLVNIELQSVGVSAQATNELSIGANLNSSTDTLATLYDTTGTLASSLSGILNSSNADIYHIDARIFDSQGTARDVKFSFSKRAANLWDWQMSTDGSNLQGGTSGTETLITNGTLLFNTSGTLKYATNTSAAVVWAGGVSSSNVTLNFGDYNGGSTVTSQTAGLSFQSTNVKGVTTNAITGATDINAFGTSLSNATYTMRRLSATTVALYDATNTSVVEAGPITVSTTGAQTITFPTSGVTITTDGTFDMSAVANGASAGTFAIGNIPAGNVMGLTSEGTLSAGTYSIRKTSATTMSLVDGSGSVLESATVGTTGLREVYFSTSKVRLTVSSNFDETAGAYPNTIGTFTVTNTSALSQGLANDGIIQYASDNNTSFINQDGFGSGNLSAIQIDENGFVAGTFTNGETKKLYKVALAIFQNPRGLESISGSLLRVTDTSGQALIKEPGVNGTGRIVSGVLEGSTTDIANEFSQMIVAQRAFQANSTVITTVDQMLNNLLQLR